MATGKPNAPANKPDEDVANVPSLDALFDNVEVAGADATFVLTSALKEAVQNGAEKTKQNPEGWLRVAIPERYFDPSAKSESNPDGIVTPTDDQCKEILSKRENDLRDASKAMGFDFRRQTPKNEDGSVNPRILLYRIRAKAAKS